MRLSRSVCVLTLAALAACSQPAPPPAAAAAKPQPVMVETDSIPFQQGELGIVAAARLAIAEHPRDLIDAAAARRQQPLHREFRRGVQVKRPAV